MATQTTFGLISLGELKQLVDSKQPFQLWNTLSKDYYREDANIPGSKHISVEQVAQAAAGLPKDSLIVTYCGGVKCPASKQAAEKLVSLGFTNVRAFEGGLEEWTAAGYPLVRI